MVKFCILEEYLDLQKKDDSQFEIYPKASIFQHNIPN
jgi:hypothetical protein